MMKKKRLLFYLPWLLVAALCLPLAGCGDDDDTPSPTPVNPNTPEPERDKVYKTYTFDYFKQEGQYMVGYPNKKVSCSVIWSDKGASFMVYFIQGEKIVSGGWAYSNDTILTEEERHSKALSFDVEIPTNINKDAPFDIIALNCAESTLSNGKIVCKTNLRRSGSFALWDHSGVKAGGAIGKSYSLTAIEMVKIYNSTNETITVRHKGFDAKEKWYYSKANVILTSNMTSDPQGSSMDEEVYSDAIEVAPGDDGAIWSYYVPTGKKMTKASLILEINGKEVRTPPVSSKVDIENGRYYTLAVTWDGKYLDWMGISSQKQPDYSSIPTDAVDLGLPSGTKWAPWNIGATSPNEIGGYYSWGETEIKGSYMLDDYDYWGIVETRTPTHETYSFYDIGDNISGTQYDVAHVKWGENWCMPSIEDWKEVIENCNSQFTTLDGVNGLQIKSRNNGNYIFIPASGYRYDTGLYFQDEIYYWLSNIGNEISTAQYLMFTNSIGHGRDFWRYYGLPVRPIVKAQKNP